jgi:polyisoprenyl-teichoic acid--peptidoglycan teichoic acid transferase
LQTRIYHLIFNRSQFGAFPIFLQMLFAAIAGVVIGLAIVTFVNHQRELEATGDIPGNPGNTASQGSPNLNQAAGPLNSLAQFVPPLDHRINILLMGVDSNGRNTQRFVGTRSDTMMLVSVDPQSKKVGVVSIPRDSRVTIPGHGEDKINAAHAFGGPDLAVSTVQSVFTVPIERYVVVDAQGLKRLFEILGPVEVLVEKKMFYTDRAAGLHIALKPGLQTLDPTQAEEYVRFRHDRTGDIGRIDRQQWFLRQVYKKLSEPQIILKLPDLFNAANEYVVTNLTVQEMAQLAAFAKDMTPTQIESGITPGKVATINGGSYWLPDIEGSTIVFNRLAGLPLSSALSTDRLGSQDVAYAAGIAPDDSAFHRAAQRTGPVTLGIRYTKGSEQAANSLETLATHCGYKVTGKIKADAADCQHSSIVENSIRADQDSLRKLRGELPCLSDWPAVVNLDPLSAADLTLVVSPQSYIETAETQAAQTSK